VGLRDRLPGWLGGRRAPDDVAYDPADPSLVVLLANPDPAQADSAVLAAAAARGVDLDRPLLVRHALVGLTDVDTARDWLAQDGYALLPDGPGRHLAVRTQVLTALSASQERSRMAGLAQRLGGDVDGWEALGPADRTISA
jgi:hypothetical protein